jgi:hypothetical protein
MANYKTHRNIGIASAAISTTVAVSSITVLSTFLSNLNYNISTDINVFTISLMMIFGVIGSIFPDIDLKTSIPSKFMRLILVLVLAIFSFSIMNQQETYLMSIIPLEQNLILPTFIVTSLLIPYVVIYFLENIMVHRGIVHSIPFGLLSAIVLIEGINIVNNSFDIMSLNSFLIGLLFFTGFITHLVLDEMYSVNLLGAKLKKSFGTALKIFDKKNVTGTVAIYFLIIFYIVSKIS